MFAPSLYSVVFVCDFMLADVKLWVLFQACPAGILLPQRVFSDAESQHAAS